MRFVSSVTSRRRATLYRPRRPSASPSRPRCWRGQTKSFSDPADLARCRRPMAPDPRLLDLWTRGRDHAHACRAPASARVAAWADAPQSRLVWLHDGVPMLFRPFLPGKGSGSPRITENKRSIITRPSWLMRRILDRGFDLVDAGRAAGPQCLLTAGADEGYQKGHVGVCPRSGCHTLAQQFVRQDAIRVRRAHRREVPSVGLRTPPREDGPAREPPLVKSDREALEDAGRGRCERVARFVHHQWGVGVAHPREPRPSDARAQAAPPLDGDRRSTRGSLRRRRR